MGCDHHVKFVSTSDEGTSFCVFCAYLAAEKRVKELEEELEAEIGRHNDTLSELGRLDKKIQGLRELE